MEERSLSVVTILEEKLNLNNQSDPTFDAWENAEWDDDDIPVDVSPRSGKGRKPCFSHGASKARCIALSRNQAPGWQYRPKSWVRTWTAAVNDPATTPLLQAAVEGAPENDRTNVHRLRQYANLIATMTSWDGKDAVFTLRATLAAAMGCGPSTVTRCAKAAERAGILTDGVQQSWIQIEDDGEERPKRSSTVRMLILDGPIAGARKAAAAIRKQRKQVREAREISDVESEQLAAKKAADAGHNARMDEQASKADPVGTPSKPIPDKERTTAAAKIREARQQLE